MKPKHYRIGKNIMKLVETKNYDLYTHKPRWCVMYDYNNSPLFWGTKEECLMYLDNQNAVAA